MELINNTTKTLKDDLSVEIKQGSKLSIAAACFSIYAFQELKEQLSQIEQLRFIFTSPTFVTEKAKKERREFYIPRLTRERSLYGTEFEIKLRNELTQKAIARECAEWIRQKVTFKSNVSDKSIQGQIVVDSVGYTPINNFTTVELGCEKGNVISTTIVKDESLARTLLADFNEIWNDSKVLQVVTDEVIDSITAAYNENSPDFIYFVTLYNIFNEFLEDVSEDVLPNEATGFKESKIWGMLYNFQKDAALAIINKLEKYNGCILADSVGLGKTFTALAVIKYYENRNKSVLVLCPKKLTNNWNTYKDNYVNNPIAADRLRYDVLYHTDLNRTHGTSNGLDLDRLNWGNYDLVVIDESHNFRNGGKLVENPDEDAKDNRYVTLMKKVIRAGVKTKVLMLSATPVNNRFNDLKNQLALAYEGHTDYIDEKLNTTRSIDEIFRNAQRAFNTWSKWEPCDRTTENLLKMLDFDFFEVLDSVTIARSRKHIQKYYDNMIYSRLRLAKDLLATNGVIFVSLDDNESANLKKICDEVFGAVNFIGQITVVGNPRGRDYGGVARMHDYLFVYKKSPEAVINLIEDSENSFKMFDSLGGFELRELRNRNIKFNKENRPNLYYPFYINPATEDEHGLHEISLEPKDGWIELYPLESQGVNTVWRWGKQKSQENLNVNIKAKPMRNGSYMIVEKYREGRMMARSVWWDKDTNTEKGTLLVKELMEGKVFDYPKTVEMLMKTIEMGTDSDEGAYVLDFFSGSGTTAHAVMQLNAKDGGNRKFIMVQLPERTDEKSEAYKAGYKNICEIGKERIRRAGRKIKEDSPLTTQDLDIGFRVLKCDTSNMKEVYYNPAEYEASLFPRLEDNIKEDRTPEDLLFQVMLDLGVLLSSKIEETTIAGKKVFNVEDNYLIACFDSNVTEETIKAIAKQKPYYFVMRDSSMANDSVATNFDQIFATYSPDTVRKVL